ncbi:universal stress protein [Pseudonocardia sp. RS11V-5]|uniref:universal stress protein n=1 Tax=Pseudonocardia terrae TaxID=2905831 RepID=UPI001E586A54|nr:universal stress protein [Pseudonocardia terrae]MCE3556083.1 universal stress protein [Pseudonocardia terrae]
MAASSGADLRAQRGRIVVGVDGSPGSLAALRRAVREASGRRLAVHAVTAWDFPVESTFADTATVGEVHPLVAAEGILVSALVDTGVAADDETVMTALIKGHPAEVLMQIAEGADLLVVGSRGHGTIFGALLGSVSHYVAAHAACPVVVIKPVTKEPAEDHPVPGADGAAPWVIRHHSRYPPYAGWRK